MQPGPDNRKPKKKKGVPTEAELVREGELFPSLHAAVISMAYFGGLIFLYSLQRAFVTGHWPSILTGVCLLVWSLDLGGRVRRRNKWAWWLATAGSFGYACRWAVSGTVQAWRIHLGNPDWPLAIMEPALFIVCLRVCAALLDRRTREAVGISRPRNDPPAPRPIAEP